MKRIRLLLYLAASLLAGTFLLRSQETAIPDPNFEKVLIEMGCDNYPIDGKATTAKLYPVRFLNLKGLGIKSLEGLDAFYSLITLDCSNNKLERLDVSKNKKLLLLHCYNNNISELDVSKNLNLRDLRCSSNPLKSLDISANKNLQQLDIAKTPIESVDFRNNEKLQKVWCHDMPNIIYLDFSNASGIGYVYSFHNPSLLRINLKNNASRSINFLEARNNEILSCIEVDDIKTVSAKTGWLKQETTKYVTSCN